jgi:hypothetical protein
VSDQSSTAAASTESRFPAAWRFDEDGLRIEGRFVRIDEGPSEYGRRPIIVLDVDGTERALWLSQEVLRRRFADELDRRQSQDFVPGEQIVVERGAEKRESEAGRSYWPFVVDFPEGPRRSGAAILSPAERSDQPEPPAEVVDDGIPF